MPVTGLKFGGRWWTCVPGGRVLDQGRSISCRFPQICLHNSESEVCIGVLYRIQLVLRCSVDTSTNRVVELHCVQFFC